MRCKREAYVAHEREIVIQDGPTQWTARSSRRGKAGLASHQCNENYDEGCAVTGSKTNPWYPNPGHPLLAIGLRRSSAG
jgi:hypothetical protein